MADPFDGLISDGASSALFGASRLFGERRAQNAALADAQAARDQNMLQFILGLAAQERQAQREQNQFALQSRTADMALAERREENAFARLNSILDRQLKVAELESRDRQQAFENTLKAMAAGIAAKKDQLEIQQAEAMIEAASLPGQFEALTAEREATGDLNAYHVKLGAMVAKNPLAFGMLKRVDPTAFETITTVRRATALASRDVIDFEALQLGEVKFTSNEKFDSTVNGLDLSGAPQIGNTSAAVVRLAELAGIDLKTSEDPGAAVLGVLREAYPGAKAAIRQLEDPVLRAEFNARARLGTYVVPTKEQALRYSDIVFANREREAATVREMEVAGIPAEMINALRDSYAQERQDSWFAVTGTKNPETIRAASPGAGLLDVTLAEMKQISSKHRLVRDIPFISNVAGAGRAAWAGLTGRNPNQLDVGRAKGLLAGVGRVANEVGGTVASGPMQLAATIRSPSRENITAGWKGAASARAAVRADVQEQKNKLDRAIYAWEKSQDPGVAGYRESVSYDSLERATLDYKDALMQAELSPNLAPQDRMALVHAAAKDAIDAAVAYGVPESVAIQRYAPQRFLSPGRVKDDLLLPARAMVLGTTPLALMQAAIKDPSVWEQSNRYYIERWAADQRMRRTQVPSAGLVPAAQPMEAAGYFNAE